MTAGDPRAALSVPLRLYIYALHGFLTEVLFTAVWDFVLLKQDFRLHGCTSVWSLFIYAVGVFVNERMFLRMRGSVPAAVRGLVYVAWTFLWEYSAGVALDLLGSRPWDYTDLRYNVHGLIALEFAPLWYGATLLGERLVIQHTLALTWHPSGDDLGQVNGQVKVRTRTPPATQPLVNGWAGAKATAAPKTTRRRNGQAPVGRQGNGKGH